MIAVQAEPRQAELKVVNKSLFSTRDVDNASESQQAVKCSIRVPWQEPRPHSIIGRGVNTARTGTPVTTHCQHFAKITFSHHGMEFNSIRQHKRHNRTRPYILSALRLSLCPLTTSDNDLKDGL